MSLSIILLVEDTFDDDDDDDAQNVGTMRMMMMGIAVLQGRLLAAAGSENNSLHLLMSADHHFIILMSVGHIHHFRTITSTDHYIMIWQLIIASSAAYNFIIDVNETFPRLVDVNRSSLHHAY